MSRSPAITRRVFLAAAGTGLAQAICHSPVGAGTAPLQRFTPELFGAQGDGVTNDTLAFQRLANAVNAHGGGEIVMRPVTYLVGEQHGPRDAYASAPSKVLEIKGCHLPLTIRGNGARLRCASDLRFGTFDAAGARHEHAMPFTAPGYSATPYERMILVEGCRGPVEITDLELDGNSGALRIGGKWGDTGWQIPAIGLFLSDNYGSVVIRDIFTHHHAQDGLMINMPGEGASPMTIEGVRSAFNARQAASFIGGRNCAFVRCHFTDTGRGALSSAPGAGVDLEAERAAIRDVRFTDCTFLRNEGAGLVADSGDVANVTFDRCAFTGDRNWAIWANKPRFHFYDCSIVGAIVRCFDAADPSDGTKFLRCHFMDLDRRDANGRPLPPGPIADLSDSRATLFRGCDFTVTHGFALPWSVHAIYDGCTMRQTGGPTGYPRGTYLGATTISGNVDLYGSLVLGTLTLNGAPWP